VSRKVGTLLIEIVAGKAECAGSAFIKVDPTRRTEMPCLAQ
jgi:hypothetical protein